ncbi:MAG: ImuA family protein [Rhabdaerophilum sp.]
MPATMADPSADLAFRRVRLARALLSDRTLPADPARQPARISFGLPALDEALQGGLVRGALHEFHAPEAGHAAAAGGIMLALACRAAERRPVLLVRQDFLDLETGVLHPAGLPELGLDPTRLVVVRVRDIAGLLQAGAEAARCPALGAVLLESWGDHRAFDLTSSRRLALAAQNSALPILMMRVAAPATPSAATTRWQVRPGLSRALEARAPGPPCFRLQLLKHRQGIDLSEWCVEWNRDRAIFESRQTGPAFLDRPQSGGASLSRAVPALPADRDPAGERAGSGLRRAG